MRLSLIFLAATVAAGTGCATTTTQMAPVSRDDVRTEEAAQRQLVLRELRQAQKRLNDLSYPLLAAATPFCTDRTAPRLGIVMDVMSNYSGEWIEAARQTLELTDTVTVTTVTAGSAAERAGIAAGDRIRSIGGKPVPTGRNAVQQASRLLTEHGKGELSLSVSRGGELVEVRATPEVLCSFGTIVVVEGDINAFADGKNVILPWAMMRFANENELRVVIAHEIAHNAMGHIEAKRQNAVLGALFGALADVALATQGVNTGGQNTADFAALGAMTFSQDFEREADYVGMYILARAGVPMETAPELWRQFAQINPRAISYSTSHPTTAERFVRLRQALEEIRRKQSEGLELLPEMKAGSQPR